MARRRGEFSSHVARTAHQTQHECWICGEGRREDDPWEIHHLIYIASEIGKTMPLAVIQSLANARKVHASCHHEYHSSYPEPPLEDVQEVLSNCPTQYTLNLR